MKTVLTCIICLLLLQASAQFKKPVIEIGSKVPDVILTNMRNYPGGKAKLSDFNGKFIVLDFWNRNCPACIAGFPKMEKLQEKFNGKVQILLVTKNNPAELKELFETNPILKSALLPYVLGDSILNKLFPHSVEPFHVWIDGEGVLRATTDGFNTIEENVSRSMTDKNFKVASQPNWDVYLDNSKPIFEEGSGRQIKHIRYYSVIANKLDGLSKYTTTNIIDPVTKKVAGFKELFTTPIWMIRIATEFSGFNNRVILNVPDPKNYIEPVEGDITGWRDRNILNYELYMPGASNEEMMKKMRQDVENYFNVSFSNQRKNLRCYIVIKMGDVEKAKTKDKYTKSQMGRIKGEGITIRNTSIARIVQEMDYMNSLRYLPPVVDETNCGGMKVDMDINAGWADMAKWKHELNKYGFDIIESEREFDVLLVQSDLAK